MQKAKNFLKIVPVLFLVIGLVSGCGDSKKKTAVSPEDLDTLTEGFTKGSGEITQDVIDQVVAAADPIGSTAGSFLKPSTTKEAFDLALKPMKQVKIPVIHNFMQMYMNYAVLGVPFDPSGTVNEITGSDKLFNDTTNYKLLWSEITEGAPNCMYIDGLPTSIENLIKGETVDPSTVASDMESFIKSFNITFGFEGECVVIQSGDPVTGELIGTGSINFKGGVTVSDDGTEISSNLTVTANDMKLEMYQEPSAETAGLSLMFSNLTTGGMYFELDSVLNSSTFTLDFLANANKFFNTTSAPTGEGSETATVLKVGLDGAMAISGESPTIDATEVDLSGTIPPEYLSYVASAISYLPDPCNLTIIIVVDFTVSYVAGPGTEEQTMDLLWGMQFKATADDAYPTCTNSSTTFVFVYFVDEDTFFLVAYGTPTGDYEYYIILKGSAGNEVVILIDKDAPACNLDKYEDSTFDYSSLSCTWTSDMEFNISTLLGGLGI